MLLTWFSGSGFKEKLTRSFLKLSERHQLTFSFVAFAFAASSRQFGTTDVTSFIQTEEKRHKQRRPEDSPGSVLHDPASYQRKRSPPKPEVGVYSCSKPRQVWWKDHSKGSSSLFWAGSTSPAYRS